MYSFIDTVRQASNPDESQIAKFVGGFWGSIRTRERIYRVDDTISNSRNLEPVKEFLVATIPGSIISWTPNHLELRLKVDSFIA